ncbi:MAG: copper amine oxidase N-terminal domain-containing protein [Candidatus Tumulicola sp.]
MNRTLLSIGGRMLAAGLIAGVALAAFPSAATAQAVTVKVGGQNMNLNPGPIERAGRVFVPLRGIFERLGSTVVYHAGSINARKGSTTVALRIGSTQATVDGQPQYLDVAPFIVGATTYVPLRFVAQSLGANVGYDQATRVVAIQVAHGGSKGPVYPPVRPPYPPNPPPYPPPGNAVQLRAQQPAPGVRLPNRFARISAEFSRQVRGDTVRVWLDDNEITGRCTRSSSGFSYTPPAPLNFAGHTVRVTGNDLYGQYFTRSWSFTTTYPVPSPPPAGLQLRAQQPSPGSNSPDRFAVISAEFTRQVEAGSVRVLLDGNDITSRSGLSSTGFSYKPPAPLDFGSHSVRVAGRGVGGVSFDRSWSFNVIRSLPPVPQFPLTINQPPPNAAVGSTFTVQGKTVANGAVTITAGATPSSSGEFAGNTTAGPLGNFKLAVVLTTLPGQQTVTVKIMVTDPASSRTTDTTLQLRLNQ